MEPWVAVVALAAIIALVLTVARRRGPRRQDDIASHEDGTTYAEGRTWSGRSQTIAFTEQRADAWLDVVGESQRQGELEAFGGGRTEDGAVVVDHTAILLPEPTNPYDPAAVAVCLVRRGSGEAARIGYLSRDDARAYMPVIERASPRVLVADAIITGGWDRGAGDRGSFGVRLHLGEPAELWAEMDTALGPVPAPPGLRRPVAPVAVATTWDGDVAGRTVCFTGPSAATFRGEPLTRDMQELLAVQHGLAVHPRVTKAVDILVIGRGQQRTGKVKKAEEYGTLILDEDTFWSGLGVSLDR